MEDSPVKSSSNFFASRPDNELVPLRELSARLGNNPLLVQASNGNTSIKIDGTLWIKASGKWLASALREEMFMPIPLADVAGLLQKNNDIASRYSQLLPYSLGQTLRPSVETAMHSVISHRAVVHVHSINAIALAIRADGIARISERLAGLRWQWVPYAASGIPLAREIEKAIQAAPETNVFILANHGLVVCGPDCQAAEDLLNEVERRLTITPRQSPKPNQTLLAILAHFSGWQFPEVEALHALGTDAASRKIVKGGVLYPCQAIFLGQRMPVLSPALVASKFADLWSGKISAPAFVIVERVGVLLNPNSTAAERATLAALAHVTQRTEESAPVRYLSSADVSEVLAKNVYGYKKPITNRREVSSPAMINPPDRGGSWLQLRP